MREGKNMKAQKETRTEWFEAWVGVTEDNRLRICSREDTAFEFQIPYLLVRKWVGALAEWARGDCKITHTPVSTKHAAQVQAALSRDAVTEEPSLALHGAYESVVKEMRRRFDAGEFSGLEAKCKE